VLEAKAEGRQPPKPSIEAEEPGGQVVDLMAALHESVRKAQAARGEGAGDAEVHEMPTAKKKTAGKAPAKKTAKKSAAAKKPARRQRGA
jgi:DNA end-binding protein Ku